MIIFDGYLRWWTYFSKLLSLDLGLEAYFFFGCAFNVIQVAESLLIDVYQASFRSREHYKTMVVLLIAFTDETRLGQGLGDAGCLAFVQCPATLTEHLINIPQVKLRYTRIDNTVS